MFFITNIDVRKLKMYKHIPSSKIQLKDNEKPDLSRSREVFLSNPIFIKVSPIADRHTYIIWTSMTKYIL